MIRKGGKKNMELDKSLRPTKIAGDFGEYFIMYWLNKRGFEVILVDYVGIDLIATEKHTNISYGISVKTRTRATIEKAILPFMVETPQIKLIRIACKYFKCEPAFGLVRDNDHNGEIEFWLLSCFETLNINNYKLTQKRLAIKMSEKYTLEYEKISLFHLILKKEIEEIKK